MNLPKTYQPGEYEANIYALWESSGAFRPTGKGEPFSIVMPPPNANGNLHIGHALTTAIEDILTRYSRMKGCDTVWIPGADHAGFETWTVFEKALSKEGKSRFDYSRAELYQMTWDFVSANRGNMELQLRALGASCDWDKLVFTLDDKVVDTVYDTFKKMWNEGLIYRGERVVNYCTFHQTGFADIEVDYQEEKSKLWYVSYPLENGKGNIEVATTRPETILGDSAVAVNPKDKRYSKIVGQNVILPVVNRVIPIVADMVVETEFGTGAVKVTPAHDAIDFEIGQRHNLPVISVIGDDGLMTKNAPDDFTGLSIDDARKLIVEKLEQGGNLVKIEDFTHQVPHCYKCGNPIQPLIKKQWFVSVKPLVKKSVEAIESGKIKFTPKAKGEELVRYFSELRDWNISRQIPWGIPIPAFRRIDDESETDWIFDTRVNEEFIEVDGVTYKHDEDTFDTWFSSGQLPYIVTRGDMERFYPTSVMETGFDILRQWVARMIMLGIYISDEIPFRHVYLHGLVLDENNQKMSKSKNNVVNPMDTLSKFGSDALRMGLIANRSAGISQAFSTATVVAGRNFCNKLWNIARFVADQPVERFTDEPTNIADHWILRQLDSARDRIDQLMSEFRFAEAYETIYHVIWDDVADWYVEATKQGDSNILKIVLEFCLKLAHPFAPFLTETIWQSLYSDDKSTTLLISQQWPNKLAFDELSATKFERIIDIVKEVRYLTKELGGEERTLYYENDNLLDENIDLINKLTKVSVIDHSGGFRVSKLRLATIDNEIWLSATKSEIKKHFAQLQKRLDYTKEQIKNLEKRLSNKSYVKNAPAELVAESRAELAEKQTLEIRLKKELENNL